jgi:hypothetical protein
MNRLGISVDFKIEKPNQSGRILTVLALTWLACANVPAMGEEVTFTESATASGSLDGHSFASSSMTITAVADPSNWVYHIPDIWTNELPAHV